MTTNSIHNARTIRRIIAAAALGIASLAAHADGRDQGFEMKAVTDRNHGDLVMAGQYNVAISRNRTWAQAIRENTDPDRVFPFAVANNLCVAYTMGGKRDEAGVYCDAAERAARVRAELETPNVDSDTANWATALSNRGVLRALGGDEDGARADFRQALALDTRDVTVTANLGRLEQGMAEVAQQSSAD